MTVVQLTQLAKARLWSASEASRLSDETPVSRSLSASRTFRGGPCSAALEIVIPRGPVTGYAMLGASFAPNESMASLRVTALQDQGGALLADSIATPPETPTVGLPSEFVEPVLEGAIFAAGEPAARPSGDLVFDRGAFGPIGSNALLFRQLAAALTRMLLGEMDNWEEVLRQELERS